MSDIWRLLNFLKGGTGCCRSADTYSNDAEGSVLPVLIGDSHFAYKQQVPDAGSGFGQPENPPAAEANATVKQACPRSGFGQHEDQATSQADATVVEACQRSGFPQLENSPAAEAHAIVSEACGSPVACPDTKNDTLQSPPPADAAEVINENKPREQRQKVLEPKAQLVVKPKPKTGKPTTAPLQSASALQAVPTQKPKALAKAVQSHPLKAAPVQKTESLAKAELREAKRKEIGARLGKVMEDAKGGDSIFKDRVVLLPFRPEPLPTSSLPTLQGRKEKVKVNSKHVVLRTPLQGPVPPGFEKVVLAAGCFWGLEMAMWKLPGLGIYSTAAGYAAGSTPNPSYEEVCSGRTGAAEAVLIVFNPDRISLVDILRWFWECHDPTQKDAQGNDIGTQYRSGLYYFSQEQRQLMDASKAAYQKALDVLGRGRGLITTEILAEDSFNKSPGSLFYFAEEQHQQYFAKPGNRPYCSALPLGVTLGAFEDWAPSPALLLKSKPFLAEDFWEQHGPSHITRQKELSANIIRNFEVVNTDAAWKEQLGSDRHQILRLKGTEAPGSGEYDRYFPKTGVFKCAACELPVYAADSKFESDCGWPCFDEVIYSTERGCHVLMQLENDALELVCSRCGSHLGHVFFGEKCTPKDERH